MSHPDELWSSQIHEDVGFFGSVGCGASLLLALPASLWRLYVHYLWKSDAHPWIASAAATFQLLAILVIAPFALLSLLDVGAYVIARTLGVVETTRASTTDSKHARGVCIDSSDSSETEMVNVETSPVHADVVAPPEATTTTTTNVAASEAHTSAPSPPPSSASKSKSRFNANPLAIPIPHARYTHFGTAMRGEGPEAEACFFSPSDERQLELSGALLYSPTPSRQASPALERRQRTQSQPLTADRLQTYDAAPTSASSDASSTAESEPFTVLEPADLNGHGGPEGDDDSALSAIANLRRRGAGRCDDV